MTLDILTPTPVYTVNGPGPYAVKHGYLAATELLVEVESATGRTVLSPADFTLEPASSLTGGALTLVDEIADAHAGSRLAIARQTAQEQGFSGAYARDKGLEATLDRLAMAVQDARRLLDGAIRTPLDLGPIDLVTARPEVRGGKILAWSPEGYAVEVGPHLQAIESLIDAQGLTFPLDLGWTNDPTITNTYDLGWTNEDTGG
ncbi:MAG: hypothetical protein GYB50_20525 [Rhodobacteraceae bacterium]|nr:hypothetical protein [Paracoccaceae bacterium]